MSVIEFKVRARVPTPLAAGLAMWFAYNNMVLASFGIKPLCKDACKASDEEASSNKCDCKVLQFPNMFDKFKTPSEE